MGKINSEFLRKCSTLEEAARHICKKAWGVAYISGNTIYTNKPGWFIGEKGKNILSLRHLGEVKVVSFEKVGIVPTLHTSGAYIRGQYAPAKWHNYSVPSSMIQVLEASTPVGF